MTQYKSLNLKLSNCQLNKLKSVTKSATKLALKLSSNMMGNSNKKGRIYNSIRKVTNNRRDLSARLLLFFQGSL